MFPIALSSKAIKNGFVFLFFGIGKYIMLTKRSYFWRNFLKKKAKFQIMFLTDWEG